MIKLLHAIRDGQITIQKLSTGVLMLLGQVHIRGFELEDQFVVFTHCWMILFGK